MSSTQKNHPIMVSGGSTPAPAKGRGKRGGKQTSQKKQPGRGMGVAQLERIRIHSLITELNPSVPLPATGFSIGPPGSVVTRPTPYILRPGQFHVDPVSSYYQTGEQNRVMGGLRPELPSIPNADCGSWGHYDFNTFNFKKKRTNDEDLEGFMGTGRETKFFQGPEIVAVHRKGRENRNVVMEYGFFPANSESSSMANVSSSSSTSVSGYDYPSTSIDLSLRL